LKVNSAVCLVNSIIRTDILTVTFILLITYIKRSYLLTWIG